MYKNLSAPQIGVFGRHTDLIELALTYKFQGLDLALDEVLRRAETLGPERACVYLLSSGLRMGGWEWPFALDSSAEDFSAQLEWLAGALEVAAACSASRCLITAPAASVQGPFAEQSERLVVRLQQLGSMLAKREMQLAVGFRPCAPVLEGDGVACVTRAEQLWQLVEHAGRPNVGLLLDTWNWTIGGGDLGMLSAVAKQVFAVRLSDLPATESGTNPSHLSEVQRLLPSAEGGVIDHLGYLRVLQAARYAGPVSLACHPQHIRGAAREATVRKAGQILDALFSAAREPGYAATPADLQTSGG